MKWILWAVLALVALAGLIALIGWMLPVKHQASRSAHIPRPPEQVYETIADVARHAEWFDDESVSIAKEVVEARPSSRFVTRIADPNQPFGGTWTFEIAPEGSGSRVTITEDGEVYNPVFRFMARFVFGYTATMEAFLKSLERKLAR